LVVELKDPKLSFLPLETFSGRKDFILGFILMSAFWLPYTVVAVTSKSVECPPSLLTEGDGTQGWLTDLPTARCTLYVDLGDRYDIGELALSGVQATHIELKGSSHPLSVTGSDSSASPTSLTTLDAAKVAAATVAIDRAKLTDERTLVPRTELQSMFVHKKETSNQVLGSAPNGDGTVPAAIPTQKIPVDPLCGKFCQTLILHFYCLWEPTTRVGVHSLAIRGKASTGPAPPAPVYSPSPVAVAKPVTLPPTPPVLTPEKVSKPVADTAPALTAAAEVPPAKRKPVEAVGTSKPSPSPGTAPSQEKATPTLTPAEVVASTAPSAVVSTAPAPVAAAGGSTLPLRHCVLVLSGYQNPLRSEIRDKALSIGAKVSNDWGTNCTHLICATAGTPKYVEVSKSGHGVVVSADWVLESWKGKKRQRESDYFIGDGGPDAASYGKGKVAAGAGGGTGGAGGGGGGWSSVL
jgi:hypothetical protein